MKNLISFGSIARRSIWYFPCGGNYLLRRGLGTSTPYRTADPASYEKDKEDHQPAVPHGRPEETKEKYEPETGKAEIPHSRDDYDHQINYKPAQTETEPLSPPKPPLSSSNRLESTGVHNPVDPTAARQKRSINYKPVQNRIEPLSPMHNTTDPTVLKRSINYKPVQNRTESLSHKRSINYKPVQNRTELLSPSYPGSGRAGVDNLVDLTAPQKGSMDYKSILNRTEPLALRRWSHRSAALEEAICAAGVEEPSERARAEEQEDDRDYFATHKASPLAEIQVADTRKPIARATDGSDGSGPDVVGWRPEQLDTAEQALLRAVEIWRRNAERGDPDSPHGRVLRELRGEWF